MALSLASRTDARALAAAMSRHPAGGARAAVPGAAGRGPVTGAAPFATVAALLTGPWRVNDPVAFDAAMRAAPVVAGHPVVDICACARQPTAQLDPLSAAVTGHLESAVAGAAGRSGLALRWVAARGGPDLYVEAAARAPADGEGPELLVLAHLIEPLAPGGALGDDSWVVVVIGDGRGGVAGIGRAALPAGARPRRGTPTAGSGHRLPVRLNLGALRAALAGPARAAEGLDPTASGPAIEGVVLPFRR